jgi:hypothetical protein
VGCTPLLSHDASAVAVLVVIPEGDLLPPLPLLLLLPLTLFFVVILTLSVVEW